MFVRRIGCSGQVDGVCKNLSAYSRLRVVARSKYFRTVGSLVAQCMIDKCIFDLSICHRLRDEHVLDVFRLFPSTHLHLPDII